MGPNNKKRILLILLLILAGSITYRLLNPIEQERIARLSYTGVRPAVPHKIKAGDTSSAETGRIIRLDLLTEPRSHSGRTRRDIFNKRRVTVQRPQPASPPRVIPPANLERRKVQEQLDRFRTFGYMDQKNERTLFLEYGRDILVVRKGDRINGKYLVKDINPERLTLWAEMLGEHIHIDLTQF